MSRFISSKEAMRGLPLGPGNFVSTPKNQYDVPVPFIPNYLDTDKIIEAESALETATQIVGLYGLEDPGSRIEELNAAKESFRSTTGVELDAVFELALQKRLASI